MFAACVVKAENCADALEGANIAAAISIGHSQRIHLNMGFLKEVFRNFYRVPLSFE